MFFPNVLENVDLAHFISLSKDKGYQCTISGFVQVLEVLEST